MQMSMEGQSIVIGALAIYKQWKIDNRYGNKDTFNKIGSEFKKYDPMTSTVISLINTK